ncbi:MAG: hypothetical protein ACXWC9_02425 [Pseudobdellovibrionaceae bacterium]
MENFKPVETPFWKKIMLSPFLHVGLIFVLVFVTIFFIRQRQKDELRARVEYLKGGPVLVERSRQNEQPATPEADSGQATALNETDSANSTNSAKSTTLANPEIPAPNAPAPSPVGSATSEAAGLRAANQGQSTANRTAPNRAVIIYAEVDRGILNTWVNELRTSGQLRSFDSVTMGPLPQITQKMKNPGVKILQQLELSLVNQSSPYEWFVGTHRGTDLDNEMGFFSSLTLSESKDALIRGEVEVQRAFRDPNDPGKVMERISFGGPFEMPMGSGFVMRGLLPGKYATDLGEDSNSDPFLSIFKSRGFRTEETEFTLIIDFDTAGPQNK